MLKKFDDSIFDQYPDLRESLMPNDYYPELDNLQKNNFFNLPIGSFNTKVIINNGKIVERVYKTPKGKSISMLSQASNSYIDQAA